MGSEQFKNNTEAIKNIVIAAAVIIGGIWSLVQFNAKFEAEIANANFQKLKNENLQRPIVSVELRTEVIADSFNGGWLLNIDAIMKNSGKTDTALMLEADAVRVAKIVYKDGSIANYMEMIYATAVSLPLSYQETEAMKPIPTRTISLLTGHEKRVYFSFNIQEPGVYMISFTAEPGREILEARERVSKQKHSIIGQNLVIVIGKEES